MNEIQQSELMSYSIPIVEIHYIKTFIAAEADAYHVPDRSLPPSSRSFSRRRWPSISGHPPPRRFTTGPGL